MKTQEFSVTFAGTVRAGETVEILRLFRELAAQERMRISSAQHALDIQPDHATFFLKAVSNRAEPPFDRLKHLLVISAAQVDHHYVSPGASGSQFTIR